MNTRRVPLYSSIVLLFLPTFAFAQGLVPPCNNPTANGVHSICGLCDFYTLIQHIINFLIGLSIPIAVFLFAYAGFLYFTSAANPGNIGQARKIFTSALIGFLIAISGWLLVQTIINALVNPGYLNGWSWNTLSCANTNRPGITGPQANLTVTDWLGGVLGNLTPPTPVSVVVPPGLSSTCTNGAVSANNTITVTDYCTTNIITCTTAEAKNAIAAYNASQAGRTNTINLASGVKFHNLDPALLQDILDNVAAANTGAITITAGSNGAHVPGSNHYAGLAVDIGWNNGNFNNFITTCYQNGYVFTFDPAYKDSTGMYWVNEGAGTANSTGNHWHVSTNRH